MKLKLQKNGNILKVGGINFITATEMIVYLFRKKVRLIQFQNSMM